MSYMSPNDSADGPGPAYKDRILRLAASLLVMASRYAEGKSIFPATMVKYADVYDNDPGDSPPGSKDPGYFPPGIDDDVDLDKIYRPEKPDPEPYGPYFEEEAPRNATGRFK